MADDSKAKLAIVAQSVSLPDVWTVDHWAIYTDGRRRYDEGNPQGIPYVSRYSGCVALIKGGIVHITGDTLERLIDTPIKELPMSFVGTMLKVIAIPLEEAIDQVFLG